MLVTKVLEREAEASHFNKKFDSYASEPEGNGPLDERATMHVNELKSQNLTSDLKSETSITLIYMCMLPKTAILTSPDAMAASKWPQ